MNLWAWIGLIGIIILTLIPLLFKGNRTKEEIRKAVITVTIVLAIIIAVTVFQVNYLLALFVGAIAIVLLDKKTYTKKRLLIYGAVILLIAATSYFIFRDNPDYVLNHVKENPETTSLYVSENGEERITYQTDVVRPLASTVKILIAVEYAMQVDAGLVNQEQRIPIDDLNQHYYENTDGGAHEAWLKTMENVNKIQDRQVTLHDVAKGMMTYSSNANTDYLMHVLGIERINERGKSLNLTKHEEIYPIVSALLLPEYLLNRGIDEDDLAEELEKMPMEMYRDRAEDISLQMADGTIDIEEQDSNISFDLQRVWSDRLIGASANDYGKLLAIISNDELPETANEVVRDLLEWPMEINEGNKERFTHLGAKGGSTAFILNDAMYAEDHEGNKIEFVLLTDDLNIWQHMLLSHNLNSFESQLLGSEDYRLKVLQTLSDS